MGGGVLDKEFRCVSLGMQEKAVGVKTEAVKGKECNLKS